MMKMNLTEWKSKTIEEQIIEIKEKLREGLTVTSIIFSDDEIKTFGEEIDIEDFAEDVDWEDEINLEEDLIEGHDEPQEYLEFIPEADGEKMDLFFECDLDEFNPSIASLNAIKELVFAEDYDYEIDEDKNRAKIQFRRAGGKISKRKKCAKGMRLRGRRCVPQTGGQKAKERVKGIRLKRAKKAMGKGKKKLATIRSKITKRRTKGRSRNWAGLN